MTRTKGLKPQWWKPKDKKEGETVNTASATTTATANATTQRPKLFCYYYKKENHTEDRCFMKQREQGTNASSATTNVAVALLCYDSCPLTSKNESNVNSNTFRGISSHGTLQTFAFKF